MKKVIFTISTVAVLAGLLGASSDIRADKVERLVLDNGTVFLISKGERRGFPSPEVFFSHGYSFDHLQPATPEDLTIPEKPVMVFREGTLAKQISDPTVYIIAGQEKRPFTSGEVFTRLGYSFKNLVLDSSDILSLVPAGQKIDSPEISHPEGSLVNIEGTICKVQSSGRECFSSPEVFESHGYSFDKVVPANQLDIVLPEKEIVKPRSIIASRPSSSPPASTPVPATTPPVATPAPTATPTSTAPAIPATPATPAVPSPGTGTPATPAVPATPAQPAPPPAADTTAPTISNLQASNITETSATISWATNEPASSEVQYALSSPVTATTTIKVVDTSLVTSHSVNLAGLSPTKIYYYFVVSNDAAGNTATSTDQSFTTLTPPPPPPPVSGWSNVQITNFSGNGNIYYGEYPAIAWSGNGYGIVWEGHDGNPEQGSIENIFFARLDQNGNMIGSPVRLSNHGYCGCLTAYPPNIAWSGSNYGVVWGDVQFAGGESGGDISGNYLRLVTLDSDGNKLTDNLVSSPVAGLLVKPGIKVDGNNFVTSLTEYAPDFTGRASTVGGKIYFNDTNITNELVSTVSGSNSYPHIHWTGSKYVIVWMNIQNNQLQLYFGVK